MMQATILQVRGNIAQTKQVRTNRLMKENSFHIKYQSRETHKLGKLSEDPNSSREAHSKYLDGDKIGSSKDVFEPQLVSTKQRIRPESFEATVRVISWR